MNISEKISLIKEINDLWNPVYPGLARHIQKLYGRQDGNILEIGPFSGVIFTLQEKNIGNTFSIASFPPEMGNHFLKKAKNQKHKDRVKVIESDPFLYGIEENTIDLAIFRGAFFFPSLGEANFMEIQRVLKPGGLAFVGGGFGKYTPDTVIKDIGKRSRDLNLRLGKIHINQDKLLHTINVIKITGEVEIISEGGLWVLIKK